MVGFYTHHRSFTAHFLLSSSLSCPLRLLVRSRIKGEGFRNVYKGHMDKTKGGQDKGWEVGMAGVEGSGGEQMETTVLEQQ